MGLDKEQQREVLLAGLLHDVGAFSLDERLKLIDEENLKEAQAEAVSRYRVIRAINNQS